MKTVLHVASVFPANSNRLALQFGYAEGYWQTALLHLTAREEDLTRTASGGVQTLVLPHSPPAKDGDPYLLRRARSLARRVWNSIALARILIRSNADVLHAHENSSLWALAFWVLVLRRRAVWDPHDYFHYGDVVGPGSLRRKMFSFLERQTIKTGTPVLTVSYGMTDMYRALYPHASFRILKNYAADRGTPIRMSDGLDDVVELHIKRRNKTAEGRLRLVYPGLIKPDRFELSLIRTIGSMDGVRLDIFGEDRSGRGAHNRALEAVLREQGIDNIYLKGAYRSETIIPLLEAYHFAIFPYLLTRPNMEFCLPNKFFQAIEAGLPLITSNMKEMATIIREHRLGYTFPAGDNQAVEALLRRCSDDYTSYPALVRNVIAYRETEIDYDAQRKELLKTYSGEAMTDPV